MGLLPKASAEVSGAVTFDGVGLLDLPDRALRDLRGDRLAMIFQEPMTSLNPSYTIGEQIVEGAGAPSRPLPRRRRATRRSRC
jgi:peptide/nickel transport system ATP-binding protein